MNVARIAVDARPLCHPGTGIYRYTMELLTRMVRMGGEWFLYSPQAYDNSAFELPNVHHCSAAIPPAFRASQLAQLYFPRWARRDRVQVLWGPRHQLPLLLSGDIRTVVTIHDLVWKAFGDTMRFPGRQIENFFTPRSLARADVIAVVSRFTADELSRHFPQYAHKVILVPGASMLQARSADFSPDEGKERYFLFVGTMEPRKNLPRLVRAFARYVAAEPAGLHLKIVGGQGWGGEDIGALAAQLGISHRVQFLGRVNDERLGALYRDAYALLMPSLYEGFGLPVVEALSQGIPVITSRSSAMSEAAGEGSAEPAGIFVNPLAEEEIYQAMADMGNDRERYARLQAASGPAVSRYDWDRSAATMAGLLL